MGYISAPVYHRISIIREASYPPYRETLQYFLEDLQAKLEELEEIRPKDRMDPEFDRYFYSDHIVHYNENPSAIQDVLRGIEEVTTLIAELDEDEVVAERVVQLPGQMSFFESHRERFVMEAVVA